MQINKALIIVPTYNESETIERLIERVLPMRDRLSQEFNLSVDLLVVDDGSPDGTAKIVEELGYSWITVMKRERKSGLGPSYIAGFQYALDTGYHYMVEMDADLSHQPEALIEMFKPIMDHKADLTIGVRWMPGGSVVNWPRSRQLISRAGTTYARLALKIELRDITSGYRVFRKNVLSTINFNTISSKGYGFQIEMALATLKNGFTVKEVPITFVEREGGVSKMNKAIVFEALWKVTIWGIQRVIKRR
jgi:dolichol-phosphate mannosyltransferase